MIPAALMGTFPESTAFQHRSDGFVLELPSGRVRVRERIRPLARAGAVFATIRRELGFSPPVPQRAPEIITTEGERAASHYLIDGDRACSIGLVFADDFYRSIVGVSNSATAPEVRRLVDKLIVDLPLGLAQRRRRRFAYDPPPGWHGLTRHRLIAEWLAPRFPRERAMLTVFPARPFVDTAAGAMDRHLHEMTWGGYTKGTMEGPEFLSFDRLSGVRWKLLGTWLDEVPTYTEVVLLHDGAFLYMARLDHDGSSAEAHRKVLDGVMSSIKPLPHVATHVGANENILSYLVE